MDDNDKVTIMPMKLSDTNYVTWASIMKHHIWGKGLWGIVDGSDSEPKLSLTKKEGDKEVPLSEEEKIKAIASYEKKWKEWRISHAKIMSWLINSVDIKKCSSLAKFDHADKAWEYLKNMYSLKDIAHVCNLQEKVRMMTQGDKTIREYYNGLSELWEELSLLEPKWHCAEDIELRQKQLDAEHFYQFITGLRPEFETTKSALLHRGKIPSIVETIEELTMEENRLRKGSLKIEDDSVLAVSRPGNHVRSYRPPHFNRQNGDYDKKKVICHHCHEPGHYRPQCPKLKELREKRAAIAGSEPKDQDAPVSLAQLMEILQPLIKGASSSSEASTGAAASSFSDLGKISWLLDSGASFHMTPNNQSLSKCVKNKTSVSKVFTADGTSLEIEGIGNFEKIYKTKTFSIPEIRHVPKLNLNLLSVSQISDYGCNISFSSHGCWVQDRQSGKLIGEGHREGGLYYMDFLEMPKKAFCYNIQKIELELWHKRLGHPHIAKIQHFPNLGKFCNSESFDCKDCILGKMKRLPFQNRTFFSSRPLELIHSDVWGPAPVISKGGFVYYVIFVDDFSRHTWMYFLKHKSEVFSYFQTFHNMVKNKFQNDITIFRTDSGGEFLSTDFQNYLKLHGITHQRSCPYTPQQNGLAERKHRHIIETTRTLLIANQVPKDFWAEAALTATYLINRMPSSSLQNITPIEKLMNISPDYSRLRIFGCKCFIFTDKNDKLSPRAILCAFLGYAENQKGYRCFDFKNNKLYVSRNVSFLEKESFFDFRKLKDVTEYSFLLDLTSTSDEYDLDCNFDDDQRIIDLNVENEEVHRDTSIQYSRRQESNPPCALEKYSNIPTRQSSRISRPPEKFVSYESFSPTYRAVIALIHSYEEPSTYFQAKNDIKWIEAMKAELDALEKASTWNIQDLPPGKKTIGCRWVYKIKTKSDGTLERYKARLVAKGYAQEYGIDYEETFAPVARMTTVRTLIALASIKKWSIFQMDVKNAFLNGKLVEEVYMEPPPGLSISEGKVLRLEKALYGLKQAPKAWYDRFSRVMIDIGFQFCLTDTALFIKNSDAGIIVLLLYVDDMIITGSDKQGVETIKTLLKSHFEMTDLGLLRYFLGIEVAYSPRGYLLSQTKFAFDIVFRSGITDDKKVDTPEVVNVKMKIDDGELLADPTPYRQLVGALSYLSITRPDIAHAVHTASQFQHAPTSVHMGAVMRIIRYIKSSLSRGLFLSSSSSLDLIAYTDADWGGDPNNRHSTTGFCVFLGESLISWRCKKQQKVSLSSTEAEYRAMATTTMEVVWLRRLLADMGAEATKASQMCCDNKSAIYIASNRTFHERTKHIEMDCHYVREEYLHGIIDLPYVTSEYQLADFFTKPLAAPRFHFLLDKLSLIVP
jgi:transposase InsO family protein